MDKDKQEPRINQATDYQLLARRLEKFITESNRPLSWLDIVPIASEIIEKYPNSTIAILKELLEDKAITYNKEDNSFVVEPIAPHEILS